MQLGNNVNHEVDEAVRDAAKADAAVGMGLFELVNQMQNQAVDETKPKKLESEVAKQIGAFAKARAREARQCQPDAVRREEKEHQMGLFDFDELELGNLLGVGGFSNVYEITAFHPKEQPSRTSQKQRKHRRSRHQRHRHDPASKSIREEDEEEAPETHCDENSTEDVGSSRQLSASYSSMTHTQEHAPTGSSSLRRLGRSHRNAKGRKGSTACTDDRYTKQQHVARKFLAQHAQRIDDATHTKVEDVEGQEDENDVASAELDRSLVLEEEEIVFSNDDGKPNESSFRRSVLVADQPSSSFEEVEKTEKDGEEREIPVSSSPEDEVPPLPLPSSFRKGGSNRGVKNDDPMQPQVRSSTAATLPTYSGYEDDSSDEDDECQDENEKRLCQDGDNRDATFPSSGNTTTARYAIKYLRQGLVRNPEKFAKAAMDLSCEAEMMMCLEHPHIVKLRGFCAGGPGAFKTGEHTAYFLIVDRLVETLEDRIWGWRRAWKNQRRIRARSAVNWFAKRVCCGCSRLSSCRIFSNGMDWCRRRCSRAASAAVAGQGGDKETNDYPTKKTNSNNGAGSIEAKGATSKPIDPLLIERLKVAYDLSSALEYLHDQRIVYRDMKSSNIGFDIRGDVKLFDFGLSRFLPKSTDELEDAFRMSNVGTRRYTAPEVEWKLPYNHQADVYSFGVVLWELMTMSSPRSLKRSRKHHELPVFRCCPCWPVELQRLIRQMLSVDHKQRPSIAEVRMSLKQILMDISDKETSEEIMLDDNYHRRRRSTFRMEVVKGSGLDQLRQDYDHLFGDFDNKSQTSASTMYSNTTSVPHEAPPTPVSTSCKVTTMMEESLDDDEREEGTTASHQNTPDMGVLVPTLES